jgi:glycosyltransferase involved in cell wall biosynthesis
VVVQRRLTHYRVAFFESLRQQLGSRGLDLVLAYGSGTQKEEQKKDSAELSWAHKLPARYFAGGRICYQPLRGLCRGADMLVVTQENKLVCNLWHQFGPVPYKVALWGHGANLQGDPTSIRERFKQMVSRRADWWFGYTESTRPFLAKFGFPENRVTILNNAVDTTAMRKQFNAVDSAAIARWRAAQNLGEGPVGIFLGSFYHEKRIELLLDAAKRIHILIPAFKLLLVGAGPQTSLAEQFCSQHKWARFAGMQKGEGKVVALATSTVMLNPGSVGLGILDSLVCEVPMITTDCGSHGPEIAYLRSGVNGLMTNNTLDDYVKGCVDLIKSPSKLLAMKEACRRDAATYTVENMARNFADGVEKCLRSPAYHRSSTS